MCRRVGLRPRLHNYEHRSSVLCNVRVCDWCLRRQQRYTRLGVDDLRPDEREEGRFACYREHVCIHFRNLFPGKFTSTPRLCNSARMLYDGLLTLFLVSLADMECAAVYHTYALERCLFRVLGHFGLGIAMDAYEGE